MLDTKLKSKSEWHVYRQGAPWQKSWEAVRASIQTDDFVAVCFDAAEVETYRVPDKQRHPGQGRLGPNLSAPRADLREVVNLLLSYPDPDTRLRDVMVDQHVMQGVGNVYRCVVLWACELSPWAHVGELAHHDAVRNPDQFHVRKLHPGALVAVIHQYLDAGGGHRFAGLEPQRRGGRVGARAGGRGAGGHRGDQASPRNG